jgi:DNA-binding transcriptional MerR regulator
MPYTKQDLVEQSGLASRTIRNYIKRGLIPPPIGHGLGATYGEEHMARAVAIGRMRAQRLPVDAIAERVAEWTTAKFKRFVAATEPPPPAEAPNDEAKPPPAPSLILGLTAAVSAPTVASFAAPPTALQDSEPIGDLALPAGPSFRIVPLLPGLGLIVESGASGIVQRVAAEICAKYGGR